MATTTISKPSPQVGNEEIELDGFVTPDDSDEDPTFDILEETQLRLSNISIKKSRPRKVKEIEIESGSEDGDVEFGVEIPELDEKDGICFEKVEKMIQDGQLEKLKVDQCKVYLRKYGLRLTGNKSILLERIREHLEVINGGGEKKYPVSSFVLNCKGDACTGDVVMFEQKVYEMFSIASRSATGPPCGTRTVAGRIVKESYGAAKQQHTFTIEVLWSKGEKALPPLHPLLIKGRNLYRLQTMRQKWVDEEHRRKVLQEKHERGCVARCSREVRIQKKEMRKKGTFQRMPENKETQHTIQQENVQHPHQLQHHQKETRQNNPVTRPTEQHNPQILKQMNYELSTMPQPRFHGMPMSIQNLNTSQVPVTRPTEQHNPQILKQTNYELSTMPQPRFHGMPMSVQNLNTGQVPKTYNFDNPPQYGHHHQYQPHPHGSIAHNSDHMRGPQRQQEWAQPRQWCRFYRQGRCNYGDNCKYLHG